MARRRRTAPEGQANPAAVEAAMQNWSPAVVQCRLNRHSWAGRTARHLVRSKYWQITQQCEHGCGVTRSNEMDEEGYLLDRWRPHYPAQGYLLKGVGRMGVDGMAVVRLHHVTGQVTEEVQE
jgi:hypothetical protein